VGLCFDDSAGELEISCGWGWITGGVVNQDESASGELRIRTGLAGYPIAFGRLVEDKEIRKSEVKPGMHPLPKAFWLL